MAALCNKKLDMEKDRQIMALENGLRQGLKELGRMTLTNTLSQAEGALEREIACPCGGRLHYQRRRKAQIESLFGWTPYKRSYYAECKCGQGRAPLDEEFGLKSGEVTPGLALPKNHPNRLTPHRWAMSCLLLHLELSKELIFQETDKAHNCANSC